MRIYFARHGESQANLLHEISNRGLKHGLTRQGREQAAALARRLQGQHITRIYSSPVLRAIETSVIVANLLDLDYEVAEALREYDCGTLEGRSDEAAWQQWKKLYDDWNVRWQWEQRFAGGENFYDIQKRFTAFIDSLIQQYGQTDENLLCISHGGLYSLMLPQTLDNIGHEMVAGRGFDYTTYIIAEAQPDGLRYIGWSGEVV
jgi:broad specificity phosphatase PhoE